MELLAPAGNLEILKQAVQAGADSVYFGGQTLNARRNANNFSDEEMLLGIDYCHLTVPKLYHVNTIVFEEEGKQRRN
jgi:putative protease